MSIKLDIVSQHVREEHPVRKGLSSPIEKEITIRRLRKKSYLNLHVKRTNLVTTTMKKEIAT